MYEQILKDPYFLSIMNKINNTHFITDQKWDWEHGLGHAQRVSQYIKRILTDCKQNPHTVELGMIAGLLHDIGLVYGKKEGHAKRSAQLANKFLKNYPLGVHDRELIVQAIYDHSYGQDIQSVIGAALLLADKLDISYYRVIKSTIQDKINNEFLKMKRVDVEIDSQNIWIYYKTDSSFNIEILKYWEKALTIPLKVANYFQKSCTFKINHQILPVNTIIQ